MKSNEWYEDNKEIILEKYYNNKVEENNLFHLYVFMCN